MPVHEFGIIEDINNSKIGIAYEPVKYDCISVDDEIIDTIYERLLIVKTYFHSLDRPEFGLAYSGITIIPPESLSLFYDVVISLNLYENSLELYELAQKIKEAYEGRKYMIHYGI